LTFSGFEVATLNHYGTPEILNTDEGSQYTSEIHTQRLKNKGITISMDGKGRATDHICIERFWRSAKCDRIYLNEYNTIAELNDDCVQRKYFIECTLKRSILTRVNKESKVSVLIVWGVIVIS